MLKELFCSTMQNIHLHKNALSKKPIFKIALSHKIPLLQKNLPMSKCLTQKKHSLKNNHNHKKEPREILQKKISKKSQKKNFQKKIEERLPRFSRSQIGGGVGVGLYKCVMVVALLYTCTGTEMGKQAGGHR